jgi:hypothetical protein
MDFVDTQIVSYAFKGNKAYPIRGKTVSSIVISEFLRLYIEGNHNSARFYPILLGYGFGRHFPYFAGVGTKTTKKHSRMSKHRTDQMIIDFNGNYEAIVEYGSLALSNAFKYKNQLSIYDSISHLDKEDQKEIKEKVGFLFDNNIQVLPIGKNIIDLSFEILYSIEDKISFKENFRNSYNDLLIASTAFLNNSDLQTNDSLLNRIIADNCGYSIEKNYEDTIKILYTTPPQNKPKNKESKGYINKGWRYSFNKKNLF